MIFRKKEKKEKRAITVVDYRMSGFELFRVMFISTIVVSFVAWTSMLLLSLLYFFSFISIITLLIYGMGAKGARFGRWFIIVLAIALFFFAFSLNPSNLAYLIGAYGSALTSPVAAYRYFLRDLKEKRELAEAFGYEWG